MEVNSIIYSHRNRRIVSIRFARYHDPGGQKRGCVNQLQSELAIASCVGGHARLLCPMRQTIVHQRSRERAACYHTIRWAATGDQLGA